MQKKQTIFFIIMMLIFFIIHLVILILELIPRVLYPVHITLNIFSLLFLIEVVLVTVYWLLKHKNIVGIIVINFILLIPAFLIFKIELSCSESYTDDTNTYLKFDREEINKEISSYFPLQINDEDNVKYSYFYETFDIVFYSGTNVEVCLEQKFNANDYTIVLNKLLNEFNEETLSDFKYNEKYKEISLIDSLDYTMSTIKKGTAKKILINEKEYSITFVYIKVEDKIKKDKLYYFKNIVE